MRIKWLVDRLRPFPGIILVSLGAIYENLLGTSPIAWVIIITGFLYLYLSGTGHPRHTPLEWPVILLSLTAVLSILITATFIITFTQTSRLLASLAMFYAIVFWGRERERLLITAVALVCQGVLLAVTAPFIVDWLLNKGGLVPGAVYVFLPPLLLSDPVHPNVMATLLILIMPVAAAFALANWPSHPNSSPKLFILAALACLLMGITFLLTKSRGGYLVAALSILLLLWWFQWRKTAVILTLIVAGVGFWLATAVDTTLTQDVTDTSTVAFRLNVWQMALTMMSDFPFTGVGMGTFNDVASRLYPFPLTANPGTHNLFLQVAIDLGFIGLIAFTALVLLTLYMGYNSLQLNRQRQDDLMFAISAGSLAGFAGLLLHGLVDNTVWGTRMAFIPWVVMGLITAVHLSTLAKE